MPDLNRRQFPQVDLLPRTTLYHYGSLGDRGKASVAQRGLLPFTELYPDFYDKSEETPEDHSRVWGFSDPDVHPPTLGDDRVTYRVPSYEVDFSRGPNIGSVGRAVDPSEIERIETVQRGS